MNPCVDHGQKGDCDGYGRQLFQGKVVRAHRAAYCKHNDLSLDDIDGVVIRHKCDNSRCINGEHLEPGTNEDNLRDKMERGRQFRKLSDEDVAQIRERYVRHSREHGTSALAKQYDVSPSQIHRIVSGRVRMKQPSEAQRVTRNSPTNKRAS